MRKRIGYIIGSALFLVVSVSPVGVLGQDQALRGVFLERRAEWSRAFASSSSSISGQRAYVIRRQYRRAFERQQAAMLRLEDIMRRLKPLADESQAQELADAEAKISSAHAFLDGAPGAFETAFGAQALDALFSDHRTHVVTPLQEAHKILAKVVLEIKTQ